jgi:hypothetical protein
LLNTTQEHVKIVQLPYCFGGEEEQSKVQLAFNDYAADIVRTMQDKGRKVKITQKKKYLT